METKFTKGEWIITTPTSKTDPQRIATTAIQENPNKVPYICDMWGMATDEGKANAKLISAAPELFNALEELLAQVKQFTQGNIGEQDYFRDEISNAKKALNKAVGSDSF